MKIKTSELTGPALDWAVAKFENPQWWDDELMDDCSLYMDDGELYSPSTDLSQGGLIIEREGIDLYCTFCANPEHDDPSWRTSSWRARYARNGFTKEATYGKTALIAAMRCYVLSKLGDEVDIPEELL